MFVIPRDRLPPGFAERIESPPAEPARPTPAATAVLARDGGRGPEVLLLRRLRSAGFVPGAYVFPGGRVDDADADPRLLDRVLGEPPLEPAPPFWLAAVRELFEETGVLLARDAAARSGAGAAASTLEQWRDPLLEGRTTLVDILSALDLDLDLRAMVHIAHWITPIAEPRRYDTHFFLARLPPGASASADPREMSDAIWLRPHDALDRFRAAELPMVFPTVRTLETLAPYGSVDEILADRRTRPVHTVMPRLVRTDQGVGIVVDDEGQQR